MAQKDTILAPNGREDAAWLCVTENGEVALFDVNLGDDEFAPTGEAWFFDLYIHDNDGWDIHDGGAYWDYKSAEELDVCADESCPRSFGVIKDMYPINYRNFRDIVDNNIAPSDELICACKQGDFDHAVDLSCLPVQESSPLFQYAGYEMKMKVASYAFPSPALAIRLDDKYEPYCYLTVNLVNYRGIEADPNGYLMSFVDTNNCPGIDQELIKQGYAEYVTKDGKKIYETSGFCEYPLMRFNPDKLRDHDEIGFLTRKDYFFKTRAQMHNALLVQDLKDMSYLPDMPKLSAEEKKWVSSQTDKLTLFQICRAKAEGIDLASTTLDTLKSFDLRAPQQDLQTSQAKSMSR